MSKLDLIDLGFHQGGDKLKSRSYDLNSLGHFCRYTRKTLMYRDKQSRITVLDFTTKAFAGDIPAKLLTMVCQNLHGVSL